MGKFNYIEQFNLDPLSAYAYIVAVGACTAMGASGMAIKILYGSRHDWRRDFLYKSEFPLICNVSLLLTSLLYLSTVDIVNEENDNDSSWICQIQALFIQFLEVYVNLNLLVMVISSARDVATVMIVYPEEQVSKEALSQLLRLSAGGALGIQLDTEKLKKGIIAQAKPKKDSSSDSESSSDTYDSDVSRVDPKFTKLDVYRERENTRQRLAEEAMKFRRPLERNENDESNTNTNDDDNDGGTTAVMTTTTTANVEEEIQTQQQQSTKVDDDDDTNHQERQRRPIHHSRNE